VVAIGTAICPDCHMPVTGRVLPDEHGNKFIIHPSCPATGRASIVPVLEEV
jgi:predicted amidohydrolase